MGKFMKYEIKGNYRFILGILAIVIIASTIIQINMLDEMNKSMLGQESSFNFMRFLLVIAIFVIFGAYLVAAFRIIGSFRNELYEDRGYLTFTLPLTGNQIVGAKLIVAVMWIIVLGIVTALYNIILASILFKADWKTFIQILNQTLAGQDLGLIIRIICSGLIFSGVSLLNTLILIYFSMALSKVSIRNKKIGGLWFIIYVIINITAAYLVYKFGDILPLYLDLENLRLSSMNNPWSSNSYMGSYYIVNITNFIGMILVSIGAFIGTGYLIEKKIDL